MPRAGQYCVFRIPLVTRFLLKMMHMYSASAKALNRDDCHITLLDIQRVSCRRVRHLFDNSEGFGGASTHAYGSQP